MEQIIKSCNCEQCQLRTLFFSNVNSDQLLDLCEIKVEKSFAYGDIIINEGEPIREFIYMKEGLVKLSRKSSNSKEQIISFAKPFDFVSLLSVFSAKRYKYSVTALENTVVCMLNLDVIKKHARENAMFTMDLITGISEATDKIIVDNL